MSHFFYFISDQFFVDFPDPYLMKNTTSKKRPCFFAFTDKNCQNILWLIPISSQIEKYRKIESNDLMRYNVCDRIHFSNVMGHEKAFLIQNMFPITKKYIQETYMDKNTKMEVTIKPSDENEIIKKANRALRLHKKGFKILFCDIDFIINNITDLSE